MSETEKKSHSQLSHTGRKKRKFWLITATLLFLLAGIGWLAYWFLSLRYYVKTDDAYVAGNQINITAQVSGSVNRIWFDNTDFVRKGDVLVSLNKIDAQQTLERAKTALALSVRQIHQQLIDNKRYQANIRLQETALNRARANLQRRLPLGDANLIGREELQHAKEAVAMAQAQLDAVIQQYQANYAAVLATPLTEQPAIKQNAAALLHAWLALQRTDIRSPIDGYVAKRSHQWGAQISPTVPLMVIVPALNLWVNANFKETQLADVRINQPVTLTSDLYGEDVVYHGRVLGIEMGTGSAFSLLPAQNATGNWIKVVQRLPVKIVLNADELERHPLRIGLSMLVKIDIKDTQGQVLAIDQRQQAVYTTDALEIDLAPAEQLIAAIIEANAS